jgi:alkylhydroperoxidase family enzyme
MATYLPPVERPKGLLLRLVYVLTRRQFGKVSTPIAVHSARMPRGFLAFYGKVSRLDRKLRVAPATAMVIREQVATVNMCLFCMDASRWYAIKASPDNAARFDALAEYATSPLFTEAERAALDYVSALTRDKHVDAETFARLAGHYGPEEICDIVWLVASEHLYNMTNIGLHIGSDGLCEVPAPRPAASRV